MNKIVLGIDLGTTHSLAAVMLPNKDHPELIPLVNAFKENLSDGDDSERFLLPSVISYHQKKWTIGSRLDRIRNPLHTAFSIKRLLGLSAQDLPSLRASLPYPVIEGEGLVKILLGEGAAFTPVELSSFILKQLKENAEASLGFPIEYAVITVPAYFNDAQRQATRLAGRLAGLHVLRILNEPTAAALSYGVSQKEEGYIAVYDLGGGTFDLSLLRIQDGIFEVLATQGNTTIGGDDFDQLMAFETAKEWGKKELAEDNLEFLALLLEAAEKTKRQLSKQTQAELILDWEGQKWKKAWSQESFINLIHPLLEKTAQCCRQALEDAQLHFSDLSEVLLVGGSTRSPGVQSFVEKLFGQKPNTSLDPETVVALGAAIQGNLLGKKSENLLLLDVTPLSLGIETYGGKTARLIPRNSRIPAIAQEVFTTFVDGQTSVDIHVVQGEAERVDQNRSLARFQLKEIPPLPAGRPRIEVSFLVDADGILQVTATDLLTQKQQAIEVRPSSGLTCKEIEKMLFVSQTVPVDLPSKGAL